MKGWAKISMRKQTTAALWSVTLLGGCMGSSSQSTPAESYTFAGAGTLEKNSDLSWTLSWVMVPNANTVYQVFAATEGTNIDYTHPVYTTNQGYYRTKSLAFEPSTCFVVRLLEKDTNTVKKCTGHTPFSKFAGISSGTKQDETGNYLLRWAKVPAEGGSYRVFMRRAAEEYNFNTPSSVTTDDFFLTPVLPLGEAYCFLVRYFNDALPTDTNTHEFCPAADPQIEFAGVTEQADVFTDDKGRTSAKITWTPSSSTQVVRYRIYLGSDFKNVLGTQESLTLHEFTVTGLTGKHVIGVRAVDKFNREDSNTKLCPIIL